MVLLSLRAIINLFHPEKVFFFLFEKIFFHKEKVFLFFFVKKNPQEKIVFIVFFCFVFFTTISFWLCFCCYFCNTPFFSGYKSCERAHWLLRRRCRSGLHGPHPSQRRSGCEKYVTRDRPTDSRTHGENRLDCGGALRRWLTDQTGCDNRHQQRNSGLRFLVSRLHFPGAR